MALSQSFSLEIVNVAYFLYNEYPHNIVIHVVTKITSSLVGFVLTDLPKTGIHDMSVEFNELKTWWLVPSLQNNNLKILVIF